MIIVINTDNTEVKNAVIRAAARTDLRIVDDESVEEGAPLSVIAGALIAADMREVMRDSGNTAVSRLD